MIIEQRFARPVRPFPWLLAVCGLVLAGCASDTNRPAAPSPEDFQAVMRELQRVSQCVSGVENRPDLALLRARTPGDQTAPNAPVYSDTSLPSDAEVNEIRKFQQGIIPCRPDFAAVQDAGTRARTQDIDLVWADQQALYADLANRALTWGQFNRATRGNADRLTGLLAAMGDPTNARADNRRPVTAQDEDRVNDSVRMRGLAIGNPDTPMPDSAAQSLADMDPLASPPPPTIPGVMPSAEPRTAAGSPVSRPPPAPRVSPPGRRTSGRFLIHLASYRDAANAEPGWQILLRQAGGALSSLTPTTRQVDVPGKGRYTRLFGGPFANRADASSTCNALQRRDMYCQVVPAT